MFKLLVILYIIKLYSQLVIINVKYPIYVSIKCCEEKHVDLLLIGEGENKTLCSYQ